MQSRSKVLAATQREAAGLGAESEQGSTAALDLHSKHYNCKGFPTETMTGHRSKGNLLDGGGRKHNEEFREKISTGCLWCRLYQQRKARLSKLTYINKQRGVGCVGELRAE